MAERRRRGRPAERRNVLVERAVTRALERIDHLIQGGTMAPPTAEYMAVCDELLARRRAGSAKVAALALLFYWLEDPSWNPDRVPTGLRGEHGGMRLSEQLNLRQITMHGGIVDFGQNLGWKGDVTNVRLLTDYRLGTFLTTISNAGPAERERIADYLAWRFAESRQSVEPMPPVGPRLLTFMRAKELFHGLLALPTGGAVPQFLVAALLAEHRERFGREIRTHRPHAADAYDRTAGDIEEYQDGELVRAYEVTMRPEWKDRISGIKAKMDRYRLSKYVVIANGINRDDVWSVPARAALALAPYERDIAVVDILDVVHFFAAELAATELEAAINRAHRYLIDLSGRPDYQDAYLAQVRHWLDTARASPDQTPNR